MPIANHLNLGKSKSGIVVPLMSRTRVDSPIGRRDRTEVKQCVEEKNQSENE